MNETIETVIRAELADLRRRIAVGKGEWGTSRYVPDGTWGAWVHAEQILSMALVKAGLSDGKK